MVYPPESTMVESVRGMETGEECPASKEVRKPTARLTELAKWMVSFPAALGMLLVGQAFYEARTFFVDPDVWWHIRVGQDILRNHHFPTIDTYSYTAASTMWIAYEWLGEIVLGSVAKLGGNTGLFALLAFFMSGVLLALYCYGTLRSGNCKAGFVATMLLSPLALLSFTLRPQMFGYLYLLVLLIVLEKFRAGVNWPVWTLPMLFLAWVNTHGSFIIGIGVLTLYLCCGLKSFRVGSVEAIAWSAKQRIRLEIALLLSLAVLPLTPYGTELAVYPFDMMFNQPINISNIIEWRPMPFDQGFGKIFLGMVLLVVVLQIMFRATWRLEELLLAAGGAVMASLHARMLLLFVPFFLPILSTMLARWIPSYQRAKEQWVLNGALMAVVVAAMIYYLPSNQFLEKKLGADFPIEAVKYLDAHELPGPMLNNYYFGGYLVGMGRKSFIDGRGDLFERTGVMADFVDLSQMRRNPFPILDRYQIASCLVIKDEALAVVLAASPNWKQVYHDGTAAIFVRASLSR